MWFKTFFMNSLDAFIGFLTVLGGGYSGEVFYTLIGIPAVCCFIVGCYQVVKQISNLIYYIKSRRRKK